MNDAIRASQPELSEEYCHWLMDFIQTKAGGDGIDRQAMSAAALFLGITGLIGEGSKPEQWDGLSGVAVDVFNDVIALISIRMSALGLPLKESA